MAGLEVEHHGGELVTDIWSFSSWAVTRTAMLAVLLVGLVTTGLVFDTKVARATDGAPSWTEDLDDSQGEFGLTGEEDGEGGNVGDGASGGRDSGSDSEGADTTDEDSDSGQDSSESMYEEPYFVCSDENMGTSPACKDAVEMLCGDREAQALIYEHKERPIAQLECLMPGEEPEQAEEQIPSQARSAFMNLSVEVGGVKFQPDLLGFGYKDKHTHMYVDAETQTTSQTMLGREVELRAEPVEFHWDYGDGTTRTTYESGSPLPDYDGTGQRINKTNFETETSHVYKETGVYPVNVEAVYYGEYRVDGGRWQAIPGQLTVDASPGEADIWTQNSRWVSGACESQDQWGCNGPIQFDPSTDRPPKIYQDQYDENGNWIGPAN